MGRRETRPSRSKRGYDSYWYKVVRPRVLFANGIPRDRWHLYDVDHRPAYNPAIEPDHWKYQLVPMLRAEHSRKTSAVDGGLGHGKHDRPHIKIAPAVEKTVRQEPGVRIS